MRPTLAVIVAARNEAAVLAVTIDTLAEEVEETEEGEELLVEEVSIDGLCGVY